MNAKQKRLNFNIMKRFLKVDEAIVISNAERIKEGKEIIKNKKHLSRIIAPKMKGESDNIYMQLYRAETLGFVSENVDLIDHISSELNVERDSIIYQDI